MKAPNWVFYSIFTLCVCVSIAGSGGAEQTKIAQENETVLEVKPVEPVEPNPVASSDEKNEVEADAGAEAEADSAADEDLGQAESEIEAEEEGEPSESEALQGTWTKRIVFSTDDGSFKFQPRSAVQSRFRLAIAPEARDSMTGTGFSLNRARLGFQASLFEWAGVYMDSDFATGWGKLVDFFVDLDPFDGAAVLRIGRFTPWYGRQNLANETELAMIEYAKAWEDGTLGLNLDRDLGASVHGLVARGVEYGVGIWNGENNFDPAFNLDFELGGRIGVHPLALAGVGDAVPIGDESDSEISPRPGLAVGVAFLYDRRRDNYVQIEDVSWQYYDHQFKTGIDAAFKYLGLSLQGELFLLSTKIQSDTDTELEQSILEIDRADAVNREGLGYGAYLQGAYFVLPKKVEAVARFDIVDEDADGLRGVRLFPALGGTYYLFGNNLKAQLMYRLNVGAGYGETDPGYIYTSHHVFLMFQASI